MFYNVSHQVSLRKTVELLVKSGCPAVTPFQYTAFSAFFSRRDLVARYLDSNGKNFAFLAPLLVTARESSTSVETLILTDCVKELERVKTDFQKLKSGTTGIKDPVFLRDDGPIKHEIQRLTKKPAIIVGTTNRIIDHLRRNNIELHHLKYLVLDITENQNRNFFDKDVLFITTRIYHHVRTAVFLPHYHILDSLEDIVKRPIISSQERKMTNLNEESIKRKIGDFITIIKESEDPILLKSYQKLIKKHVPFHLRGYFSAFLLKSLLSGSTSSRSSAPRAIAPGTMQTLFINIGKTRRVYPNDLSRFFQKSLEITPEKIGPIKVLANYSFIDIHKDAAENAVAKLDGITFRGKTITVNFARKKGERMRSSAE